MFKSVCDSIAAVQEFLRNNSHESFEQHGIKTKTDGNHLILDYDMLNVKWLEPYGYVCRGLILDANTFEVLCFGLHKFFNLAEGHAATIDWSTAHVFEKCDGTMVNRWWSPYTNRFEYSTRCQLPSDIKTNQIFEMGMSWEELINRCVKDIPEAINQQKDETITFEVMSPANRVVVLHKDFHARMIARRNNHTLEETSVYNSEYGPKAYSFSSSQECVEFANTLSGLESEGFVVTDANFNRVKIKGRDYLALHHLKDSAGNSLKSLILVVRRGEWSEVGTAFPEFIPAMDSIGEIIQEWTQTHCDVYESIKDIEGQKEFALAVQAAKLTTPSLLFSVRSGRAASVNEAISMMNDNQFVKVIKPMVNKAGITILSFEEE